MRLNNENAVIISLFIIQSSVHFSPIVMARLIFLSNRQKFGLISKWGVRDRFVPLICLLAPLICLLLDRFSTQWFFGYSFGNEILIVNAGLTFLGLLIISCSSARNEKGRGSREWSPYGIEKIPGSEAGLKPGAD